MLRQAAVVALAVAMLLVAACDPDGDDGSPSPTRPPECSPGPSVRVTMDSFSFAPDDVTICGDQRLILDNPSGLEHNFTIQLPGGEIAIATVEAGDVFTTKRIGDIVIPGKYEVLCRLHSGSFPTEAMRLVVLEV